MFFKKKKLLNIKYKRTTDSRRLLDKQFSIADSNRFRISIKDSVYFFNRLDDKSPYHISTDQNNRGSLIDFGKTIKLKHQDGTDIYFTLHEDFLYSIDYDNSAYALFAIVANIFLFISIQVLAPLFSTDTAVLEKKKEEETNQRVADLLKKMEEKKAEPTPTPVPTAIPTPESTPEVVRTPEPQRTPEQQIVEKPKKKPKTPPQQVEKNPPKRLVVEKSQKVQIGGTGPKNPNASKDVAARAQATKVAATNAKVTSALGFLTAGKGAINIPPTNTDPSSRFLGSRGLSGLKEATGRSALIAISNKNSIGSVGGPINTTGSRNIASGPIVSDGEVYGSNKVLAKVSVAGLHQAGGSGSFGSIGAMSASGNIDQDAVRRAIEKYMSKIRYCYEKALLSKPSMSGGLRMEWKVNPGGRASGVKVVQSSLNDGNLHGCVSNVISTIPFPNPKGGPATVAYPFNFTPFN
jgi:outer membrane biosynthesis protein TonB